MYAGHLPIVPGDRDCSPTGCGDDAAICGIASRINVGALLEALRFIDCHCCSDAVERVHGALVSCGLRSFWVASLYEFVGRLLGRVPLDHLPSANITIDAAAVSNGQFGIAHDVLRPAMPTDKVAAIGECSGAHRGILCALALQHASTHLIVDWSYLDSA